MALTDIKVKTAKPKDKPYKLADGGGMYLLINTNGSKYWRMKYRFAGKEKMLSIGVYPDVTLADARENAVKPETPRCWRRSGEAKRKKNRAANESENTFEAIAREWHQSKADRWSLRYRDEIIDTFEKTFFPTLASALLPKSNQWSYWKHYVKWKNVELWRKCAKVRQRCGEVFRYAIVTGRADYNPAPDLASALATPKKYIFLSYC